ncbi:hypothetical protein [Nocardia jejuensis]|uniref:hypothetical protein n=1 Tax=Nocardia jejuensis TaxID=328049 RepID=UPI00082EF1A5|nr:hypothetical protein [Nocardia jejuensis]
MNGIDLCVRLNLAIDMWERRHGRPLADEELAEQLTDTGCPVSGLDITAVRQGEEIEIPGPMAAALAVTFGVDPEYFAARPVLTDLRDTELTAAFHNRALRRLGQLAHGMPISTLLYLDTIVEALRRAEDLPETTMTARI